MRRNCLKSLNIGYTLLISRSIPIQNPLTWWISDPVQSKSAWTGLADWSSPFHTLITWHGRVRFVVWWRHLLGRVLLKNMSFLESHLFYTNVIRLLFMLCLNYVAIFHIRCRFVYFCSQNVTQGGSLGWPLFFDFFNFYRDTPSSGSIGYKNNVCKIFLKNKNF